jgi:hypothetical protein
MDKWSAGRLGTRVKSVDAGAPRGDQVDVGRARLIVHWVELSA